MSRPQMPIGQQYLRLVLSRWRLVSALVIGCTLGAWLFSVLVLANKPEFESAARLNIVPTSEELGYANRFVRGSTFDGGSVLMQTYAEFAHTRPVVAPIVDRYIAQQARAAGLSEADWIAKASVPSAFDVKAMLSTLNYGAAPTPSFRDKIIDAVIKYTLIENVEGTYLIRLTVTWDDPVSAAWFANALADAIIDRAETAARASGGQLSTSLGDRLTTKKAELAQILARSRAMKASIGVVDLDRQKQSLLEARVGELSQLTTDRAALKLSQGQVAGLRRETGGKLSPAQAQLEQSLAIERPRAAGMAAGIGIRERRIADIDGQIAALGRSEDAIKTLDASATALQAEIAALTERSSFTEIENLANAPKIQLIERAVPPSVRSSPKVLVNTALGFVAGCALAGCALLLLGGAPVRVRRPQEDDAVAEPDDVADGPVPPADPADNVVRMAPAIERRQSATPSVPTAAAPPAPAPAPAAAVSGWSMGAPGGRARSGLAVADRPITVPDEVPEPVATAPLSLVPPRPVRDDRIFAQILPQPIDGQAYDAEEQAAFAPAIAAWLAAVLRPDGRPVLIAGEGGYRDAQLLCGLLYRHLRETGIAVPISDATGDGRAPAGLHTSASKPLIYAGGERDAVDAAIRAHAKDDVEIVVAVGMPAGERSLARAVACRDRIGAIAARVPYVIAVSS